MSCPSVFESSSSVCESCPGHFVVFLSKTLNSKSVTLHLSINPLHTNISKGILHTGPIHSLRC